MSSLYAIDKLDDNNYGSWKIQMKNVLIHCDLWSYVTGTNVKLDAEWISKDSKALATIILSVKTNVLIHIKNCKTSKIAWDKLEEIFQPKGPSSKCTLFKQLIRLKVENSQSVKDYVEFFSNINDKLIELGIEIPNEVLTLLLLCGLPDKYESFVVAIESRDELPTLHNLKIKMVEEEQRKNGASENNGYSASNDAVLYSKSKKNKSKVKCYACQKRGHYANECKNKKRDKGDKEKQHHALMLCSVKSKCELRKNEWCLDSGATSHMCCDKNLFSEIQKIDGEHKIQLASNNYVYAVGKGRVLLNLNSTIITLNDVLFVPELNTNFISVNKVTSLKNSVLFENNCVVIKNKYNEEILRMNESNGLYLLKTNCDYNYKLNETDNNNVIKWHERYGHLNLNSLKMLKTKNMVHGMNIMNNFPNKLECEICYKAKIHVLPFAKKSLNRSDSILSLVHTDICGPINPESKSGARYFVTFIDDFSRMIFVYFMKSRSEVLEIFEQFKIFVERETGCVIKKLRSDNALEFVSKDFSNLLNKDGIRRQLSVEYTPQQNGVAERANRTLVEMARCMILEAGVNQSFWAEAINNAAYLRNRSPTKILETVTPFEAWYKKKPTVNHLRIFGSKAIVLNKKPGQPKFKSKGIECILVGYSEEAKAYRLYDLETKKIIKSRDVQFLEQVNISNNNNQFDCFVIEKPKVVIESGGEDDKRESISSDVVNSDEPIVVEDDSDDDDPVKIASQQGIQIQSDEIAPEQMQVRMTRQRAKMMNLDELNVATQIVNDPVNVHDAIARPDSSHWVAAMKNEYESLMKKETWELVDLPSNRKSIGCRWVFHLKKNSKGDVERYKARLVAKGCFQKFGIDYYDTFSPVAKYSTIRILLALAVEFELLVHHLDVKTAYLNSELQEEVYMDQPECFVDKSQSQKVCKLKKSIYGLKQAGRAWNEKINSILIQDGFVRSTTDTCVYTKNKDGLFVIIVVYVDDIVLACSNLVALNEVKVMLQSNFEIDDKREISYCLGFEVCRDGERGAIRISQKQFIQNLLREYGMLDARPFYTPLDVSLHFIQCDDASHIVDSSKYQSLIGSLMYLAISTRPDIIHSVSKLSQYNKSPHIEHFKAAKHVLHYLKATKDFELHYSSTKSKRLEAFVDADWGNDKTDRKSYSGFCFKLANGVITWESKKQPTVALSSMEAEYMALSQACREVVYLKNLFSEIGFSDLVSHPIIINNDNLGAQHLANNQIHHARSKHIDIRHHFVREVVNRGDIVLNHVSTDRMTADVLTKNLAKIKHQRCMAELGLQ